LIQAQSPDETEGWDYDPNGNRIEDLLSPGTWNYDDNDRLLSSPKGDWQYDDSGSPTQKTEASQTYNYRYNAENRLAQVTDGNAVVIGEYQYDPMGRRIKKVTQTETLYFHYTDEGLAGEYDQTGTPVRQYGYAPDSTWTTDPLHQKSAVGYAYYLAGHLGTPQRLMQKSGAIVWQAEYRAFGGLKTEQNQAGWENLLRFPGQYYDQETQTHYNLLRYYDTAVGRYTTRDPIGLLGPVNTNQCINDQCELNKKQKHNIQFIKA
jgi:RHS repeat-associated protein